MYLHDDAMVCPDKVGSAWDLPSKGLFYTVKCAISHREMGYLTRVISRVISQGVKEPTSRMISRLNLQHPAV